MPAPLTVAERIVLHLSQFSKFQDEYDVPMEVSQDGIASAIRISRAHAAIELKKLKETSEVIERLAHVRMGKTKRKVYFLTPKGEERAQKIREFADREGIAITPLLDLRKCKGEDLWNSIDSKFRPILAQACVFRKPFKRSALPEMSISLLPTNLDGMVEIPEDLRKTILQLVDSSDLRRYHSFAADYWLQEGDYRERLYHLINSGRMREAEILIANRWQYLIASADEDLFSIVSYVTNPSGKYAGKVFAIVGEIALRTGHNDFAIELANKLERFSTTKEQAEGKMIKGLVALDKHNFEEALMFFTEAKKLFGDDTCNVRLDCEIIDALIGLNRYDEARGILESVLPMQLKRRDPEFLDRLYYQLGLVYMGLGNGQEAVKCLSKSLGILKNLESSKIIKTLAEAYLLLGMKDKSMEISAKLASAKKSGSFSEGRCR
ncbi:MAG: hypothetical protein QHH00_06910 [Methanomassiliicoccales archaeon]|nr:hypothetical protein [Methanomassiliicoccales archaeon]